MKLSWVALSVMFVFMISAMTGTIYSLSSREKIGVKVVKALYNFKDNAELIENQKIFKELVSEEVYYRMNSDNEDRALSVFIKLHGKPCEVEIIESSSDFVVYRLITESVEPDRLFIMTFKTRLGKVVSVSEAGLIVFPTTTNWR